MPSFGAGSVPSHAGLHSGGVLGFRAAVAEGPT